MFSFVLGILLATFCADGPIELLAESRRALESGEPERAKKLAEEALRRAGPDVTKAIHIHREAQDVLMSAGAGRELVRRYDELLRRNISDPDRRYLRARVEPDLAKRRRDLEGLLITLGEHFWTAYDLAELCAREGDWSGAAAWAERAAKAAPHEAAPWNVLGHLRLEASRFLESPAERRSAALKAKEAFEEAIRLDPTFPEAHYNLGLVCYALGDSAQAKRVWQKALELRPRFPEVLNSLGHMASQEGREDEAIAFYRKALEIRPSYGVAHNNLAVSYYRQKDYTRARTHLALAEAAGYKPDDTFKRLLTRALEEEEFARFQSTFSAARERRVTLFKGNSERVALADPDEKSLLEGIAGMTFRDSHGGARLGEKNVGDQLVAVYVEAARLELELLAEAPRRRETKTLIAVLRRTPSKAELVPWVLEGSFRFSAHAPGLARELSRILSIPLQNPEGH